MTNERKKRGKGKIPPGKSLDDAYVILKDHFHLDIDKMRFKQIAYAINKRIMHGLREGEEFTIPYRLGTLRVKKQEVNYNNLRIDYKYFNETGKKRRHLNEHSGGFYFFYRWNKPLADVKNKYYYNFFPTRTNKRALSSLLKTGEKTKRDYHI